MHQPTRAQGPAPAEITATEHAAPDHGVAPVLRFFDAVVFGDPPRRTVAIKVVGGLTVDLYGIDDPAMIDHTAALVAHIADATGLDVSVRLAPPLASGRPDSIQVHVGSDAELAGLLARHGDWIPRSMAAEMMRGACFFVTRGLDTVRGAVIGISDRMTEQGMRHCLAEEITQSFGMFDDSQLIQPSLFNDPGPLLGAMTDTDRAVLEVLYHPSIVPGMPREAVLALAAQILAERGIGN